MPDLRIEQTVTDQKQCIKVLGKMIETADYSSIVVGPSDAAEFDFSGVTMINSKGLQIWKDFMKGLPLTARYAYVRCPLKVVNQLNLFPSFKGGKTVDVASFFAPYFCEACDKPSAKLLITAQDFPDGRIGAPPPANCPDCKKPMEFDGNAQKYFLFLKRLI